MSERVRVPALAARGREAWSLVVESCPFCGERHVHGGGDSRSIPSFGHRVAHCGIPGIRGVSRTYELVPDPSLIELHEVEPSSQDDIDRAVEAVLRG